jgi:signal transduction histidine kinase
VIFQADTALNDTDLAKGLTLAITTSADLPAAIMGYEGRLRQVTLNFLSNAMKFTASGEIALDVRKIGERIRVSVIDSGIGIAPDKIDTLFERFTQADASTTRVYGGTGLGLAICREIAESLGGSVQLVNRERGARVEGLDAIVRLPLAEGGAV